MSKCPKCGAGWVATVNGAKAFLCGSEQRIVVKTVGGLIQTFHTDDFRQSDKCRIAELATEIKWLRIAEEERLKVYQKLDEEIQGYRTQNASLTRQVERLAREREEFRKMLGIDSPWPINDVLRELMRGSTILFDQFNYDGEGHEKLAHAYDAARIYRDYIDAAFAAQKQEQP